MLALFEVLSFKGWLDIRDVILQRLGAVCKTLALFVVVYVLFDNVFFFALVSHDLYSHLRVSGLHDRTDVVCWCGHRQLWRKQRNRFTDRRPTTLV